MFSFFVFFAASSGSTHVFASQSVSKIITFSLSFDFSESLLSLFSKSVSDIKIASQIAVQARYELF